MTRRELNYKRKEKHRRKSYRELMAAIKGTAITLGVDAWFSRKVNYPAILARYRKKMEAKREKVKGSHYPPSFQEFVRRYGHDVPVYDHPHISKNLKRKLSLK